LSHPRNVKTRDESNPPKSRSHTCDQSMPHPVAYGPSIPYKPPSRPIRTWQITNHRPGTLVLSLQHAHAALSRLFIAARRFFTVEKKQLGGAEAPLLGLKSIRTLWTNFFNQHKHMGQFFLGVLSHLCQKKYYDSRKNCLSNLNSVLSTNWKCLQLYIVDNILVLDLKLLCQIYVPTQ